jgi:hypothetical protein
VFKKRWNALLALFMITSLVLPACAGLSEIEVTGVAKETPVQKETAVQKGTDVVEGTRWCKRLPGWSR